MTARNGHRPIVACGHLCIDIIPGFPPAGPDAPTIDWFRPGRLFNVGAPSIGTGGSASNTGLSLHRLGMTTRLVARIGDDPLGTLVLERVASHGRELVSGIRVVPGETTSYTVVLNPPGVDRIFYHCPGANDSFGDADVEDAVLEGAGIFHFGYPPLMRRFFADGGAGLARLFERARGRGALASLDLSLPDPSSESGRVDWKAFLDRVLPRVDVFVPSIEELLFMEDRPTWDRLSQNGGESMAGAVSLAQCAALAELALRRGVSIVLIKLGERGSYLRTGPNAATGIPGAPGGRSGGWKGRELYVPVFQVGRVAGTTGAGDAAIAGFLASIAKGLPAEDALTMAVAVGACCVEAPDATSGVRSWGETAERVKGGWRRAPATVPEGGWSRGRDGTWHGPNDRG
jgi:sugar/nucleoside kinase (ribokinase family)